MTKSKNKPNTYSISDLASEFDITTRTIRFYEEKGLIRPSREGCTRSYSSADRVKLKLILRGKRLGFTLEESGEIINMYDHDRGNAEQLQALINKINAKQAQLNQQKHDIDAMLIDLSEAEISCKKSLKANK